MLAEARFARRGVGRSWAATAVYRDNETGKARLRFIGRADATSVVAEGARRLATAPRYVGHASSLACCAAPTSAEWPEAKQQKLTEEHGQVDSTNS